MIRRPRRTDDALTPQRVAAGLVVLVAVWALLDLIRHVVGHRLDEQVTKVWISARQLAQNTQALHILSTTQERAAALVEELERDRTPTGGSTP